MLPCRLSFFVYGFRAPLGCKVLLFGCCCFLFPGGSFFVLFLFDLNVPWVQEGFGLRAFVLLSFELGNDTKHSRESGTTASYY